MNDAPVILVDALVTAVSVAIAVTVIFGVAVAWNAIALTAQAVQAVKRKL